VEPCTASLPASPVGGGLQAAPPPPVAVTVRARALQPLESDFESLALAARPSPLSPRPSPRAPLPPATPTAPGERPVFYDFVPAAGAQPPPRWGHAAAALGDALVVVGGVGAAVFDDAWAYDAVGGTWTRIRDKAGGSRASGGSSRKAEGPGPSFGAAGAAFGGRMYVFGGRAGRSFLRTTHELDLEADTGAASWRTLREPPSRLGPPAVAGATLTPVDYAGLVLYGGAGKRVSGEAWLLEPGTGRWERVEPADPAAPVPRPRHGHAAVAMPGGLVLIHGGAGADGDALDDAWVLDVAGRAWARVPTARAATPAPPPRFSHAAALTADGRVFVFGGCNGDGAFLNDGWLLHAGSGAWARAAPVGPAPRARYGASATTVGDRVFLFGGSDARQPFGGVFGVATDLGGAERLSGDGPPSASTSTSGAEAAAAPLLPSLADAMRRRSEKAASAAAARKASLAGDLFRAERTRYQALAADMAAARVLLDEALAGAADDRRAAVREVGVLRRAADAATARAEAAEADLEALRSTSAAAAAAAAAEADSLHARAARAAAAEAAAEARATANEAAMRAAAVAAGAARRERDAAVSAARGGALAERVDRLTAEAAVLKGDANALRTLTRAELTALEDSARATAAAAAAAARAADASEATLLRAAIADRDAQLAARAPARECGLCLERDVGVALGCGHLACEPCAAPLAEAGAPCPWCARPVVETRRVYGA